MVESIQKTNEFFKITGIAPHDENPSPIFQSSYMIQSIDPISYEIASIWQPTGQETKASSSAGSLEVQAKDGGLIQFSGTSATAETRFDFIPTVNNITLKFVGHVEMHAFENSVTFKLVEINGNIEVGSKVWTVEETGQLEIQENLSYAVMAGTEYRITLTAEVNCGDTSGVRSILKASFIPNAPLWS